MKYFIMFLIIGLFSCCQKISVSKSEKLHLSKDNYIGDNLRIDGYYYQFTDNKYFRPIFFYKDGTALFPGGNHQSLTGMDDYINNSFVKKRGYRNVMYWWGVFNINEDIIKFEKWNASEPPYKTIISEGEIINDTTFVITRTYQFVDGVETDILQYGVHEYHFKQFNPKPDSTNTFMNDFLQ